MKTCSCCKIEKSKVDFSKNKSTKDGLQKQCKNCQKSSNEKYLKLHPDSRKKTISDYYNNNSEKLIEKNKARCGTAARIATTKKYRDENKEKLSRYYHTTYKIRQKELFLRNKYNITLLDYERMMEEQNNQCLICKKIKKLVVDHCHKSGIVRGLLCGTCNSAIGLLKEDIGVLTEAINYLSCERTNN